MVETIVRKLSDGEELVLEIAHEDLEDPRERTIETRRLAVDHDDGTPSGSRS